MLNLSNLIGKQVISLCDAIPLGTVMNVRFDDKLKELKYVEILNENEHDAEMQIIDVKNIFYSDSDVLTVKYAALLHPWELTDSFTSGPIHLDCYNYEGVYKGTVTDVVINKNKVEKIVTSLTEFSPSAVTTVSDALIVLNDSGNPVKISRPKPKTLPLPPTEVTAPVTVHEAPAPAAPISMPVKISSGNFTQSYQFMLGKKLSKDIASDDGKVLFAQNTVIDETVINQAKKCNKLIQLALHSD